MADDLMKYIINTDGGSRGNPGESAIGFVIKDSAGIVRELCGKYIGQATNNQAEYLAVWEALVKLRGMVGDKAGTQLAFYMDSLLVASQLSGKYQIKNPILRSILQKIKAEAVLYNKVTYQHIPRAQNAEADRLVNKALDERIEDLP